MVAILHQFEFKSITDPRDWSKRFDHQQPPLPGEACYVVMLIGVRRKAKWQRRTLDSMPPVAWWLGAGLFTWTRSRDAAFNDTAQFNRSQLRKRGPVRLWAAVGWGCCGFEETIRVIRMEGKA